jgi:mannan endo-1,4-beta-mannosidase
MRVQHGSRASTRVIVVVVSVALAAIGWIVYGSPLATHKSAAKTRIVTVDETMPRKGHATPNEASHPVSTPHVTVTSVSVTRSPGAGPADAASGAPSCSSFQWQQDAQAAYLADLSDPDALDGPAGPDNGDGLACGELPTDPSRTKSTPVDAFTWTMPSIPTKAEVLNPSKKYFGVAADGLPNDSPLFDSEDAELGQAPSTVEWFQNFGDAYPYSKVSSAWQRGALPVITWMSAPNNFAQVSDLSSYSLLSIAAGSQDAYLKTWAASIAVQKMPVVIRFDHEANGNWYPWSLGWSKQGITTNTAVNYVAAWQHVWNIFQSYGANNYAIWAYVPSRVDTLGTYGTGQSQSQLIAASYPGSGYVDWIGMDGYQYNPAESTTYSDTFSATLGALEGFSGKPIMIAEMGSAEQGTTVKPQWIKQTLAALAANPRIVSAIYFDNDVTGVHYIDGFAVRTNWRINSSPQAQSALQAGLSASGFGQGIYPPYLLGN